MSTFLDEFVESYSNDSKYALDSRLMSSWYPKRVREKAHGSSMLELGIGHGRTVAYFSEVFSNHVVIEGSEEVIRRYKKQFGEENTTIINGFFEDFETKERFDCISMGFVLEHVNHPITILAKFRKLLAPDGVIFIAVPSATSLHRRLGFSAGLLSDMNKLGDGDRKLGHLRYYDINSLREDVASAGLKEQSIEGIFLKPFTTEQIAQLNLDPKILEALMVVGIDFPELCNAVLMEVTN